MFKYNKPFPHRFSLHRVDYDPEFYNNPDSNKFEEYISNVIEWCKSNSLVHAFEMEDGGHQYSIYFKNKKDASLFKLTWC